MTTWMGKEGFGETDLLKQEVCEHVLIFLLGEGGEEVGRDTWGGGDGMVGIILLAWKVPVP